HIHSEQIRRDCAIARRELVNGTQQFAADVGLARLPARHHALRRGEDVDAEAAQHLLYPLRADVDAAARLGAALEARDHALALRAVTQEDAQRPRVAVFTRLDAVVGDVAFFLEDSRDLNLEARSRDVHFGVTRDNRVADARQHV